MKPLPVVGQATVSIDVFSEAQVQRVLGLIRELEEHFPRQTEYHTALIDQLKELVSAFHSHRITADPDSPDPIDELSNLRTQVLARQKAELESLRSAFEELPDALRELEVNDLPPKRLEPTPIRLPVLKGKPNQLSDPYLESTVQLLKRLGRGPPVPPPERIQVRGRNVSAPVSLLPELAADIDAELQNRALLDRRRADLLTRLSAAQRKLGGFATRHRRPKAERDREMAKLGVLFREINTEYETQNAKLRKLEEDEPRWRSSIADCEHRKVSLEEQIALLSLKREDLARLREGIAEAEREKEEIAERIRQRDEAAKEDE
jgi:hypothetical protein